MGVTDLDDKKIDELVTKRIIESGLDTNSSTENNIEKNHVQEIQEVHNKIHKLKQKLEWAQVIEITSKDFSFLKGDKANEILDNVMYERKKAFEKN